MSEPEYRSDPTLKWSLRERYKWHRNANERGVGAALLFVAIEFVMLLVAEVRN